MRRLYRITLALSLLALLLAGSPASSSLSATQAVAPVVLNTPDLTPAYVDLCSTYWYKINDNGLGNPFYLTLNVDNPIQSSNSGVWRPNLPTDGVYKVEAYVPDHGSIAWACNGHTTYPGGDTSSAQYNVNFARGSYTVTVDQLPLANAWVSLGEYFFHSGANGYVRLTDQTAEANFTRTVSFSAMRFTWLRSSPEVAYLPAVRKIYPSLRLTSIFTTNISDTLRSTFNPGQPVHYYVSGSNDTNFSGAAGLRYTQTGPCGATQIYSGTVSLSPGIWALHQTSPAPTCTGVYTYTVQSTFQGNTSRISTNFLVNKPSMVEAHTYQGFDICPLVSWVTLDQMQAWWNSSPYRSINLYMGGPALYTGCKLTGMTTNWVAAAGQQGWSFIPTWVGLQAPCFGTLNNRMSSDPATAYQQGRAGADQAALAAINLGFLGDYIIYDDLEAFSTSNIPCLNAAKAYIDGWTARLHERGSGAGVYGLASNVTPMYTLTHRPDDVWIASWSTPAAYDPSASAYGLPGILDTLWHGNRIRQYAGDHSETWGTVSLSGIDSDVLDGHVVVLPKQSAAGQDPASVDSHAPGASASSAFTRMQAVSPGTGWALSGSRLEWTGNGGAAWQDITPSLLQNMGPGEASVVPGAILGVNLISPSNGWLVIQDAGSGSLFAAHTLDGSNWQAFPLPSGDLPLTQAWIGWTDDQTGWVSLQIASSSAFSRGRLLRTSDGGRTWTELDLPAGGPLTFIDSRTGWLAGGPGQTSLYLTSDGGATWTAQTALFRSDPQETPFFGLPVFTKGQKGSLAVTVASPLGTHLDLWTSQDGGLTWQPQATIPYGAPGGQDTPLLAAISPSGDWLAASSPGDLLTSHPANVPMDQALTFQPMGLPAGLVELQAAGSGAYWARLSNGICAGNKGDPGAFSCRQETRLFQSRDGGKTWSEITPLVP